MEAYIIYKVLLKNKIKLKPKNGVGENSMTNIWRINQLVTQNFCWKVLCMLCKKCSFCHENGTQAKHQISTHFTVAVLFFIDSGACAHDSSWAIEKKQIKVLNAQCHKIVWNSWCLLLMHGK